MEELEKVYEATLQAIRDGQATALVAVIEARGSTPRGTSAKMLVYRDGRTVGTVGGGGVEARAIEEAKEAIAEGVSRELAYNLVSEERGDPGICGGSMRLFVDVILPRPTMLILGAGHVGLAMAELAAFLGYRIIVMDDRPEMVTSERFPWAQVRVGGEVVQAIQDLEIGPQTYVVMVTPHYSLDYQVLVALSGQGAGYIGLIGSRRRSQKTFELARQAGASDEFLQTIYTPIGLDIGAETPREIAICIMGEIIALQKGKDLQKGKG